MPLAPVLHVIASVRQHARHILRADLQGRLVGVTGLQGVLDPVLVRVQTGVERRSAG